MIKEAAYAKINIGLDIVEKRVDGYHNIDTIMQTISLCDEISLKKAPGITIKCSMSDIPTDESNTAHKASVSFFKKAGLNYIKNGVHINILKNIPSQAGLGGGSSDAAAVLRGLNNLYCTEYSTAILRELALEVGSDVPFCINGGTQRALGRGEILRELPSFENVNLLIIMPDESVNTSHAYALYAKTKNPEHPDMNEIEKTISRSDLAQLKICMGNAFESLVFTEKPIIEKAKRDILKTGAWAASMTGSGAALFGIYPSYDKAQSAFLELEHKYRAYLVKTIGGLT